MNKTQSGTDNLLENYFLELIINKHVIDREIQEILSVIDTSELHPDYALLLKKTLLGEKNMYLENWGTLGGNLTDIMKTSDVRGHEIEKYGIVLGTMLRIIEEIFDVHDKYFHDFLLLQEKEDIEHRVILLMKEVLDFMEEGLKEVFINIKNLDSPIENGHIRKEFSIIQ